MRAADVSGVVSLSIEKPGYKQELANRPKMEYVMKMDGNLQTGVMTF